MRHMFTAAVLGLATVAATPALAGDAASTTPAATAAPAASFTTADTDIGTLLDNPAAWAIVIKHIPELAGNEQIQMARPFTLKGIQGFAAEQVTDERLAAIDADFAKMGG